MPNGVVGKADMVLFRNAVSDKLSFSGSGYRAEWDTAIHSAVWIYRCDNG